MTSNRLCRIAALLAALSALLFGGCATESATPTPLPVLTSTPTLPPTVEVSLQVEVTPVPTRATRHRRAKPRPTAFKIPQGAFLQLFPGAGLPTSRTIWVKGGHLPPKSAVQILWAPGGHTSPFGTTTYTGGKGNLWTRFSIPGSPPGTYRVIAEVGGVPLAEARYRVISRAHLTVSVTSARDGELLQISGRKFIPRIPLILVIYPVEKPRKYIVIGSVRSGTNGHFQFSRSTRKLVPGQYILRAWSGDQLSAQMAEVPFQVVV